MSFVLAAVVAAHIQTGRDLLRACEHRVDICNQVIAQSEDCMLLRVPRETERAIVVKFLREHSAYLFLPTSETINMALGTGCD